MQHAEVMAIRHIPRDSDRPVRTLPGLQNPRGKRPRASSFSTLTKAAHCWVFQLNHQALAGAAWDKPEEAKAGGMSLAATDPLTRPQEPHAS
ncbi:hypothetical protein ABBQ38_005542 [Trebouxia sp. C0009 RCD-2024]